MPRSQAWSQLMPLLRANSSTTLDVSSTLTLTMTSGLPACLACRSLSSGRALRQGVHQVAQKSSSTTLPLKPSRVRVLPSRVLRVKAGARSPLRRPVCGSGALGVSAMQRLAARVKTIPRLRIFEVLRGIPVSFAREDCTAPESAPGKDGLPLPDRRHHHLDSGPAREAGHGHGSTGRGRWWEVAGVDLV